MRVTITLPLSFTPSFVFRKVIISMMLKHVMLVKLVGTNSALLGSQSFYPSLSTQALVFGRWLFLLCCSINPLWNCRLFAPNLYPLLKSHNRSLQLRKFYEKWLLLFYPAFFTIINRMIRSMVSSMMAHHNSLVDIPQPTGIALITSFWGSQSF